MASFVKINYEAENGLRNRLIKETINHWAKTEGQFSFISCGGDLIITDLNPLSRPFLSLMDFLRTENISHTAIGNMDLKALFDSLESAMKNNNNENKGA